MKTRALVILGGWLVATGTVAGQRPLLPPPSMQPPAPAALTVPQPLAALQPGPRDLYKTPGQFQQLTRHGHHQSLFFPTFFPTPLFAFSPTPAPAPQTIQPQTPAASPHYRQDASAPASAPVIRGAPKTLYVIPRCYAGDKPPERALPQGCDIRKMKVRKPS